MENFARRVGAPRFHGKIHEINPRIIVGSIMGFYYPARMPISLRRTRTSRQAMVARAPMGVKLNGPLFVTGAQIKRLLAPDCTLAIDCFAALNQATAPASTHGSGDGRRDESARGSFATIGLTRGPLPEFSVPTHQGMAKRAARGAGTIPAADNSGNAIHSVKTARCQRLAIRGGARRRVILANRDCPDVGMPDLQATRGIPSASGARTSNWWWTLLKFGGEGAN